MRLNGEIGVLNMFMRAITYRIKCYLVIEHESTRYVGCLIFQDVRFCYQLASMLRQYQGR
jgi:hypothetical protein